MAVLAALLAACRQDIYVDTPTPDGLPEGAEAFYLLNEGNMGSNRASIDYFDAARLEYRRNIFVTRNPGQVKELGDVGNDLAIYGSKMYAVINCSHKVQVMDAATCVSLAKIDIPNPRFAIGHGSRVYVSSYVSPVQTDPRAPRGAVFSIDTLTMQVTGRVDVGYQPEQMAIRDGRLYVANSGGYRAPNYDNTVSVIDLTTFTVTDCIEVAPNLQRLAFDNTGRLLVTSRGDYNTVPAALYAVDPATHDILACSRVPVTNFALSGDSIFVFSADRQASSPQPKVTYDILDTRTLARIGTFVNDSLAATIKMPYCIAIGPKTGNIFLSDARNYVSSGRLHCIDRHQHTLWTVKTGDIPAALAFPDNRLSTTNHP